MWCKSIQDSEKDDNMTKIKIELIENQLLTNVFDDVREKVVSAHCTVTSIF